MMTTTTRFLALVVSHGLLIAAAVASSSPLSNGEYPRRRAVVGGVDADPERFPYFVRLDLDGEQSCGGSLISRDFILTAAHCAFPSDLGGLIAVIGGHDYNEGTGLTIPVREIFQHHAYDDLYTTSNDVALLQIDPIPEDLLGERPFLSLTQEPVKPGTTVEVVGMGTLAQDGEDAEVLQQVDLTILSDEDCDDLYEGEIHRKSMVCASGKDGQDSCDGDSGGPLILLGVSPKDDIQVGIVSFGVECADADYPGVYAEISYLRPWIDSIVCTHSGYASEDCQVTVDTNLEPIILDPEKDVCRDLPGAFYANWWDQFQRCDWLREDGRAALYCYKSNEAWIQCPLTCHSCEYSEDDDWLDDDANYTNYEQSSSSVALILLFVCAGIFLIQFCVCIYCLVLARKRRDGCSTTEPHPEP